MAVDLIKFIKKYKFYLLGGGLLLLGGTAVVFRKDRGKRLTKSTLGSDDFIIEDPQMLANQANLPLDTYSLARVIASETGSSENITEKIAIGWVVKNEANYRKISVSNLITRSNKGNGRYGKQRQGRFVGSSLDPYERDAEIASNVLASISDPTAKSVRFFNQKAQARLSVSDPSRHRPPEEIVDKWKREGFVTSTSIGDNLFFRRA